MRNDLNANAELEINVTNLVATEEEIQTAKSMITSGFGSKISAILVTPDGVARGGTRFEMTFTVLNSKDFQSEKIQECLYQAGLVVWRLSATLLPQKQQGHAES